MKLAALPLQPDGPSEAFSPIGALRALLRHQGHDLPYALLMVASGAAFRHAWAGNAYATSATLAAPEPLLVAAARKFGLQAVRLPATELTTLCETLQAGHPILYWGGPAWREARLLVGYDAAQEAFWTRSHAGTDETDSLMPFAAWIDLANEGVEAWQVIAPKRLRMPDTFAILKQAVALSFAEGDGQHQFGLAAYESWALTVQEQPPLPGSEAADICAATLRTLLDAKRAAALWLTELPRPLPSSLVTAIDYLTDCQFMLEELAITLRQPQVDDDPAWLSKQIQAIGREDARAVSAIQATISIVAL